MNGTERNIEIFKPFGDAFGLMKKILFQPFDLKKWCVVGFTAWLARIGGGGYNFRYNTRSNLRNDPQFQAVVDWIRQIPVPVLITAVTSIGILFIALVIVFAWLRARGRFMFTDNVVKNGAAVVAPWGEFRREGNSYFIFSLLVGCGLIALMTVLALPFMLPIIRGVTFLHLYDLYLLSMILLWAAVLLMLGIAWAVIATIMVISMYRQRSGAVEGFQRALSLIRNYPGEITLYCLFSIAIGIGAIFASCVVMCATCCVAAIPYVGTVILLPLWVWIRGFTLLFFRQFGSDYDVWAGLAPPNELFPPPLPS